MGVDGFQVGPWVILPDFCVWNMCFFIRGKWNKLLGQPFRIWRRMGQLLLPILNQISQRLSLPICIKKMDLRVVMSSWLEQILWVTVQPLKHCTLIPVGLRFHKLVNLFAVFWYFVFVVAFVDWCHWRLIKFFQLILMETQVLDYSLSFFFLLLF